MTKSAAERTIPGQTALKTAAANPYSRFPHAPDDPRTAGWRLKQPATVKVHATPKFRLSQADTVFTMGSCFARNVENSLIRLGVRLSLANFHFPLKYLHRDHGHLDRNLADLGIDMEREDTAVPLKDFRPDQAKVDQWLESADQGNLIRAVLNKYSPFSMLNEFQRLLLPQSFRDPFKGLIQVDEQRWFDPHIKNTRMLSRDDALAARACVEAATATVADATAVFLTLGFTETWVDSDTGYILNVAPPPRLIKRWPNRFRFLNAAQSDVLYALDEIRRLLTTRVRADMKFIITVSPVPLGTTFTDMDVISANAYSKATLRSAAGEFAAQYPDVDYFPSYEMVMSTDPALAWQDDRVHVAAPVVDAVINHFVAAYFGESAVANSAASAP